MILSSTSDLLRLISSSTADLAVHASWSDWLDDAFTPGRTNTAINSATTTTIVGSPGASTERTVRYLSIRNTHASTSNTITVEHFDGTISPDMYSTVLAAGESVVWTPDAGWKKYNALGLEMVDEGSAITTDGNALIGNNGVGLGIVPVKHVIRADADETLTSTTSAQSIFDSPANGRITLPVGTYEFKLRLLVTGMSATSGNAQILFGGTATFANWLWWTAGIDNSAPGTLLDDDVAFHQTNASAASVVTAGTGTALRVRAEGSVEVSAAGTLIPQIALVTAAAAIVESGSRFAIEREGSQSLISVGPWD